MNSREHKSLFISKQIFINPQENIFSATINPPHRSHLFRSNFRLHVMKKSILALSIWIMFEFGLVIGSTQFWYQIQLKKRKKRKGRNIDSILLIYLHIFNSPMAHISAHDDIFFVLCVLATYKSSPANEFCFEIWLEMKCMLVPQDRTINMICSHSHFLYIKFGPDLLKFGDEVLLDQEYFLLPQYLLGTIYYTLSRIL